MGYQYRPLLAVFREALTTLENEPGPMIPAKAELMKYLRNRIAEHEGLDRSTCGDDRNGGFAVLARSGEGRGTARERVSRQ